MSFNQTEPYSQPIISSVTATPPNSCPGTYTLKATVQDTLALQSGAVVTSVQQVDFYYWNDKDGNGLADDSGSVWTKVAASATLDTGTLNKWTASWDASALPKGKYLIGTQALDDNTKLDDGMTPTGINNRTFSYISGDAANKVYIGGAWISGQQAAFPVHSPSQTPSAGENWYGNPDVTGQQIALVGTAINACGLAPTLSLTGSTANVVAGGSLTYTITLTNPASNSSAISISQVTANLPSGFSYQNGTTVGTGGLGSNNPSVAGQVLTWTYGSPVSLAPGASATLVYGVTATSTAGNYNATAASITSFGTIQSSPVAVAVDAARVSLSIIPSATSIAANGASQLTFTLNYSNDSTVSLSGATLTGSLPSGATYVSCSGGSTCNGSLSWTLGTLAGGASGSATLVITVPNTWSTSSLTQSATLTATAPDSSTVTKSATSTVAVTGYSSTSPAGFTLTKTASATQIAPGGSVTYTIAYNNYGGTAATSVVITDSLPAGMTYSSSTGGGSNLSNTVTWAIGTVAAGASGSVTVTATAANPFTAYTNPSSNSAVINWSGGSTVTSQAAVVGVTGTACSTYYFSDATTNVGNDGTKRIAVAAPTSPVANFVTVSAPPSPSYIEAARFYQDPAASTDIPLTGTISSTIFVDRANGIGVGIRGTLYDYNSADGTKTSLGTATSTFGGSATGAQAFNIVASGTLQKQHRLLWIYEAQSGHASQARNVSFQFGGTVSNAVSGGTTDASTAGANFCVTPPANLSTQVTVDQTSITAGTTPTLKYTILYSNTGSVSATTTSLVNTLPSGFTGCEYSTNNSSWASCSGGSAHTFSLGTVTAGSSGTVYVRGVVPSGTTGGETYTNNVSLSSDQTIAVTASAVSRVAMPGTSLGANLAMSLSTNTNTAQPGDAVVYSLTITNVGDTAATGVVVSNTLPLASYFTYASCTGGCVNTSGTLSWALGTLAAGASQTYTYTMNVGSSGLGSGITVISDDASAAGNASVSATSNTVSLSLNGNPELSGSMTATPNSGLAPGDTVTYSISLQNTGNASATSVVVSDPIPSNTSFKGTITATAGSGSFDTVNNRVVFDVGTLAAGANVTLSYKVTVNGLTSGSTTLTNTAIASGSNAAAINITATAAASAAASLELTQVAVGAGMYPAATLTANASGTTVYVDRTDAFQIGQYVKVGTTVGHILSLGAQSLTLDTSVTANSGDPVVGAISLNLAYGNQGNAPATTVSLTDTLPAGLGYYTSSPLASSAPAIGASGAVTWSIGTVDVGATGTRTIVVFPTGTTGNLTSQGVLSAGNASSATANATIAIGGISVAKSTSTTLLAASGTASYSITLTNSLGVPVTNVSVTDSLADGFSYHTNSATVGAAPIEPTFGGSDTAHQQPQWTGLTVPANSSLVINFQADAASSAGAGVYQNEVLATAGAGIGILQYDALSNTNEDVTLLGANTGVLKGTVFYRNSGSSNSFVPDSDLPLAGVRVEIYKLGADCTDPYSATCYVVFSNANGEFQKVVAAESWYVKVVPNTGELSSSWDQVVGANATQVTVPDQGSVSDQNGFKLTSGYLVSASAGTGGSISPTSATVTSGNTTTFTVTPDTGYTIASVGGTCGGSLSGASYTTNAITAACTVVASFNLTTYSVTFDLAGGTRTGAGLLSQTVAYGTGATAPTFTSPAGKTFTGWSTTFSSVTGPLTVTALYTDTTYTVTPSAGTGGNISPATAQSVIHGNTTTFTLTPTTGYSLSSVTGTCGGSLSGSSYTTNAISANCSVQANFTASTYTVVFDLVGGTRTGGGALSQSVTYNTAATAPVFTSPSGKTFTGWSTNFSSVTGPLTVTALYTDSIYTLTPSAGAGGSISPATPQSVTHGNTVSLTLSPNTGYSIGSVAGTCGGNLSGAVYTTNVITSDCSVVASFVAASYTVTFDLDGGTRTGGGALVQSVVHGNGATAPGFTPPVGKTFTGWSTNFSTITGPLTVTALYDATLHGVTPSANPGGTISPATTQLIAHGNTASFTVSPALGYRTLSIDGSCGGTLTGVTFTTSAITADCSVIAYFAASTYAVTFDLDGGTRTGGGALSQFITHGSAASAPTLTPPQGKTFVGWSTSFSSITGPLTVTALYATSVYTVTPSASAGGAISPANPQTIGHGGTTNFTITPDNGYVLDAVVGSCGGITGGSVYSTNPITNNCSVIANFVRATYPVTFNLGDGMRVGGGELNQVITHGGDAVAPTLTPPTGKTFSRWSTLFTSVTGPLQVVALYNDTTYTVTATVSGNGSITPSTTQTVAYNKTASFQLLPANGYAFAGASGGCVGTKLGDIYTTSPITGDCALNFNFNPILKSVDEQGTAFAGETLALGATRVFKVVGGSGKRQLSASVRQAGVTSSPTTDSAQEFLAKAGATLIETGDGNYRFTASHSGRYSITFSDQDGQSFTIVFTVHPNISFTSTYQESALGKTTQVAVLLDDDPIDYPVVAPYSVGNNLLADNLSAQAEFTIASGRLAFIEFTPKASSGQIDFAITAKGLSNATLGDIANHKVALKEIANIPLNLSLSAQQQGETKKVMLNSAGVVSLLTSLTGAGYSYDWSASAPELGISAATTWQPNVDPTGLSGPYLAKVTVRELNAPNRSQTVELLLHIVANEPTSYTNFYNLEYEISPNRLPICTDGGMARVNACHDVLKAVYMETLSTYEINLGRSSDYASWRDLEFGLATEAKDIRDAEGKPAPNQNDAEFLHLGYEVDFEVTGLEQAGQTVPVVIPLKPGLTIPRNAVWRKYSPAGWRDFVENAENHIHSAKRAANGQCPSPSANTWVPSLNTGDDCVRLIIQDGGPNDLDTRADGVIRDPSVLAVKPDVVNVTTVGKGRGGASDGLFLLALALMAFTYKRTATKKPSTKDKKMPKFTHSLYSATLGLLVSAAGPALAVDDPFYLDAQLGQARGDVGAQEMNARMAELGYSTRAQVSGQNRYAWKVLGGYQYSDYLAVEAGYLDLGEVRTRLSGSPVDIQDYLNSANLVHPRSASGYEIALLGRYPFDEKNSIYVRGGLLFANSRYHADAQTDFAKRSASGRDNFIGVGYGYEINDRWGLHLSAENYRVEGENIQLISVGLKYKFHLHKNAAITSPEPASPLPIAEEKSLPAATNPCTGLNPPLSCTPQPNIAQSIQLAVQFDINSDVVKNKYSSDIQKLADFLKENAEAKITIEGHTDDQGDAILNKDLSLRRAVSVKKILVEQLGISDERVAVKGYGEEHPLTDNTTSEGRERNRRVMAEIK